MSFLNVVEIESALAGLASGYPDVAKLITLPYFTAEGRQSHALCIGTASDCPKTAVLFISGAHAREWGGPDTCVNFAADILEAYAHGTGLVYGGASYTAVQIASIIERLDVIVFPDINPDGRYYSQNLYAMWRKNRNPASSGGQAARVGVDPNRNYDFLWDFNTGFAPGAAASGTLASDDPGNDLFHGTAPFSEAETKNVRWLFEQYPDIRWFMDIHSYGGDILHSWGDDANQTTSPDQNFTNPAWNGKRGVSGDAYGEYIGACDLAKFAQVGNDVGAAIAAVRGENYAVAQSFYLPSWGAPYPTSGASDDWAFSRSFKDPYVAKVGAYTMEFNRTHTFFPTWAEMELIIRDVDSGLVRFCLSAVPRFSIIFSLCAIVKWFRYVLWHRVFPPELWGPYGPWGRVKAVIGSILVPLFAPIIRALTKR